jgi:hypothetical protein
MNFSELREIGPVVQHLLLQRRHRDAALDVAREVYEKAYVCSFAQVESLVSQPLENDDEIGETIALIEEWLGSRPDDPFDGRVSNLLAVYPRPSVGQFLEWRTRHSRSAAVTLHQYLEIADLPVRDRDSLFYAISGNPLWRRASVAFEEAFADCVRSVDPHIDWSSTDAEIWRAINRIRLEHGLRADVRPSTIRRHL